MIGQIIELHANVDDANLFHEHSRLFTRHVEWNFLYQSTNFLYKFISFSPYQQIYSYWFLMPSLNSFQKPFQPGSTQHSKNSLHAVFNVLNQFLTVISSKKKFQPVLNIIIEQISTTT